MRFDWPGNVRQLENVLSQALLFVDRGVIEASDVVLPRGESPRRRASHEAYRKREAVQIAAALETTRWNVAAVSRLLGIPRTSLYRKLKEYGLERK
jgi:transcriptional regulator of acetoin/glycerol metabolism